MATAIDIEGVRKTFPNPGGGIAAAVDGVTLRVEPGELFFLLGPSGCGKTTLLRMIAGFIEATAGKILFDGRDMTRVPPNRRNTGMVFQSYALWPHMTVEQNVGFGLDVRKVAAAEKKSRVMAALEAVRMGPYAARRPTQLSGGQQQRVALARALVVRPDVLLLDEPLSNLDAKLRLELRGEIRRICKEAGITGVYVTHDQKEALSMADRVAIMSAGRLVQLGTPRELYTRPATRFVAEFLGETNVLEGTLVEVKGERSVVETAAGRLVAGRPTGGGVAAGARVLCSIRPEALHLMAAGSDGLGLESNVLHGTIRETVYLGEMAQHAVALPGGMVVRAAELNPVLGAERGEVRVAVRAGDVVVMPASA